MGIKRCYKDTRKYFPGESDEHLERIFQGWSYDLTLGDDSYITSDECPRKLDEKNPYLIIKPGDFALLITSESLELDNDTMAFISVRFTYKKQGLINISGFHIDPGYRNKIIFSVYNAGPSDIILKRKDSVFMIFFQELNSRCKGCSNIGEIEKLCESSDNVIDKCINRGTIGIDGYKDIPVDLISQIKGQSVSLAENHQKIETLEKQLKLYTGLVGSIIIALLAIIVALIIGICSLLPSIGKSGDSSKTSSIEEFFNI